MRIRMLGAALTGALMLGATLAGAASAASVPPKSFFIDPVTGEPDVVIVVGATANASDVVSGSLIAAAIGNMATVEETKTVTKSASNTFDYMMDYNYTYDKDNKNIEYYYSTCDVNAARAKWYTDYELYSLQFWETASGDGVKGIDVPDNGYDISVAIAMPKEIRNPNGDVVARELSTLWFSNSPKDWDSNNKIYKVSTTSGGGTSSYELVNTTVAASPTAPIVRTLSAYAGGSYDDGDGAWDFDSYAFFTTKAWVDVSIATPKEYDPDCDYNFGGTGTAMEAHEEIQVILEDIETTPDGLADMRGDRGAASGSIQDS